MPLAVKEGRGRCVAAESRLIQDGANAGSYNATMQFVFKYPVYAFVESSSTDPSGNTIFINPLTITCASGGEKPVRIEAIPVFGDEALAAAFKKAVKAPHTRQLRMHSHEHLIDFLTKAKARANHVAMEPSATTMTSERIWTIDAFVGELQKLAGKR